MSERRPISFTHNNNDSVINARIFSSKEHQLDISASTIAIHNDNMHLEGRLDVDRDVSLNASVDVSGNLTVHGDFSFKGGNLSENVQMGTLTVDNKLTANEVDINGNLSVDGTMDISVNNLQIYNETLFFGNTSMWNMANLDSPQTTDVNNLRVKNIYLSLIHISEPTRR